MLTQIKLLLGISDNSKDELLQLLIKIAVDNVKSYCHIDSIPDDLNSCICKMVVVDYNKIGSEGLASENYSGAAFSYLPSYSTDIINQLKPYRRLRMY